MIISRKNLEIYKNKGMTSWDIEQVAKKMGITLSGIMFDEDMVNLIKQNNGIVPEGVYILNLGNPINNGTHYTSIVNVNSVKQYYDSFGLKPPKELGKLLESNKIFI